MIALGEPLSLQHRSRLEALLASHWRQDDAPEQTLSDPWFANLYLFREAHDWRLIDGEWPRVTGRTYDGTRVVIPLYDLSRAPQDELRRQLGDADAFSPLSDAQAARLDPDAWALSASRDDADYLYAADSFRCYRGTLLQKKRNLVKQLLAGHDVQAEPYTVELLHDALQVLDGWLHDKLKAPGEADDQACRELLTLAGTLGFDGEFYRVDGRPAGFLFGQPLAPGVMVIRFAKAMDRYKGLYQHMFQQYVLRRPHLRWLNFEQDLGQANFRQTKMSYQPTRLLTKHRARLRD